MCKTRPQPPFYLEIVVVLSKGKELTCDGSSFAEGNLASKDSKDNPLVSSINKCDKATPQGSPLCVKMQIREGNYCSSLAKSNRIKAEGNLMRTILQMMMTMPLLR